MTIIAYLAASAHALWPGAGASAALYGAQCRLPCYSVRRRLGGHPHFARRDDDDDDRARLPARVVRRQPPHVAPHTWVAAALQPPSRSPQQPTPRRRAGHPLRTRPPPRALIRRFALISDVHVFDRDAIWTEDVTDFNLHRVLGLANIVFMRGPNRYDTSVLAAALRDMHEEGVEHLVCAGDITNLAMESEFALAASVFSAFGPPQCMTFCPGNHDVYVKGQEKAQLFLDYFGDYCVSDVPGRSPRGDGFPVIQLRGGILFLVLNSGRPNTAAGEVGRDQWEAAREMIDSDAGRALVSKARFRVLVQHHPAQNPSVRGTSWVRQLGHGNRDWPRLGEFARKHKFDLVVHGHLHKPYRGKLAASPRTYVYESGSGTLMTDDPSRIARYTVFDLDRVGLVRSYSRVWNPDRNDFDTLELSLPK
jgi:3',5'-cyclic AMP phosphodiesterase CpdA